jgi:predicted RNA binding protein YcfA (HicA-like mRNA interferase family)
MPKITPIHWQNLEKVFLKAGFRFLRQQGSHRSYSKEAIAKVRPRHSGGSRNPVFWACSGDRIPLV